MTKEGASFRIKCGSKTKSSQEPMRGRKLMCGQEPMRGLHEIAGAISIDEKIIF